MAVVISSIFPQTTDSDIVVCSSDNVLFHLHKRSLEVGTGAFPPANTPTNGEIVSLSESSATLEVLFQFLYPQRYPSIDELDFESVMLLAEVAEKYEAFAMIYACQNRLRDFLHTKAKPILAFAAKHNYTKLVVELAPIMVDTPVSELFDILPPHIFNPWCLWRERWTDVIQVVANMPTHSTLSKCSAPPQQVHDYYRRCLSQLAKPSGLRVFGSLAPLMNCSCCRNLLYHWRARVKAAVDAIPPFSL